MVKFHFFLLETKKTTFFAKNIIEKCKISKYRASPATPSHAHGCHNFSKFGRTSGWLAVRFTVVWPIILLLCFLNIIPYFKTELSTKTPFFKFAFIVCVCRFVQRTRGCVSVPRRAVRASKAVVCVRSPVATGLLWWDQPSKQSSKRPKLKYKTL